METYFVAGPWGSGTTAVTRALASLGLRLLQPTFMTNDPKTPDSFESEAFRNLVLQHVCESTLSFYCEDRSALVSRLKAFAARVRGHEFSRWHDEVPKRLVLKLPAACLCLEELHAAFEDLRIIVVRRSLEQIEASRRRRSWPEFTGKRGALKIYESIGESTHRLKLSCFLIDYLELIAEPRRVLSSLMDHYQLDGLRGSIDVGVREIRQAPLNRTGDA